MVYDYDRGWQQAAVMTSPTLPVRFNVYRPAYTDLKLLPPCTTVSGRLPKAVVRRAVTDMGAQLNVLDLQTVTDMGIDPNHYQDEGCRERLQTGCGGIYIRVSGDPKG